MLAESTSSRVAHVVVAFALVACVRPAACETALRLRLVGDDGTTLRATRALILPVAWGSSEVVELPLGDGPITVPLDAGWLRDRFGRVDDLEAVYLYVEASGWAPIRSDGFRWIGAGRATADGPASTATIVFPRHAPIVVRAGEIGDADIRLRRPGERTLRLVDEDGRPVGGVGVDAFAFWSRSNHCGRVVKTLPMGGGKTDARGRVRIADDDVEYALSFDMPHYFLADAPRVPFDDPVVVRRITGRELTIRLHRSRPRRLRLWVTRGRKPAEGAALVARSFCGTCAACDAELARSGRDGMIELADFYPEEWDEIAVGEPDAEPQWRADPRTLPSGRTVRVAIE